MKCFSRISWNSVQLWWLGIPVLKKEPADRNPSVQCWRRVQMVWFAMLCHTYQHYGLEVLPWLLLNLWSAPPPSWLSSHFSPSVSAPSPATASSHMKAPESSSHWSWILVVWHLRMCTDGCGCPASFRSCTCSSRQRMCSQMGPECLVWMHWRHRAAPAAGCTGAGSLPFWATVTTWQNSSVQHCWRCFLSALCPFPADYTVAVPVSLCHHLQFTVMGHQLWTTGIFPQSNAQQSVGTLFVRLGPGPMGLYFNAKCNRQNLVGFEPWWERIRLQPLAVITGPWSPCHYWTVKGPTGDKHPWILTCN